jgi:hypothetical protein
MGSKYGLKPAGKIASKVTGVQAGKDFLKRRSEMKQGILSRKRAERFAKVGSGESALGKGRLAGAATGTGLFRKPDRRAIRQLRNQTESAMKDTYMNEDKDFLAAKAVKADANSIEFTALAQALGAQSTNIMDRLYDEVGKGNLTQPQFNENIKLLQQLNQDSCRSFLFCCETSGDHRSFTKPEAIRRKFSCYT